MMMMMWMKMDEFQYNSLIQVFIFVGEKNDISCVESLSTAELWIYWAYIWLI